MTPFKRILRNAMLRRSVCRLAAGYIRLVHVSGRWRACGAEAPAALWDARAPFILALWHSQLMMLPRCWRQGVPFAMLISAHRDGELASLVIGHLGLGTISGSSRKSGAQALRTMVRRLGAGECVGITPDGPRGPRRRASEGIISVARLAGVPILPVAASATRRRVLASWDRFSVALPFSRGAFVWGTPIDVARDADAAALEAARREVEDQLNALTDEADRLCGHAPMAPAPMPADSEDATRDDDDGAAPSSPTAERLRASR